MIYILQGPIQRYPFYLAPDDDAGGGGGEVPAESTSSALQDFTPAADEPIRQPGNERVENEKLPDFGKLKGSDKPASEPKATPKQEKPAGEAPKEQVDPKKGQPKKVQTTPEVKKAEVKPTEQPKEQPKKVEKVETPKEQAEPKLPESDDDLEAFEPPPGATEKQRKSFGEMRSIIKETRQIARKVATELESAKKELDTVKSSSGQVPPEVKEKLDRYEQFYLMHNAENDEAFQQEWGSKVTAAEENIYSFLKSQGMPDKTVEQIKAAGIEKWGDWDKVLSKLPAMERRKLEKALDARDSAIQTKEEKLKEFSKSLDDYKKGLGTKKQEEINEWTKKVERASVNLCASREWSNKKEIPENASPEVKAAIEAHNAKFETCAAEYVDYVKAAYGRNPEKTAEMALRAVESGVLSEQLESQSLELDKAKARVAELEAQIARIKSAGRVAHTDPTTPTDTKQKRGTTEEGKIGGDGSAAISNFFSRKE